MICINNLEKKYNDEVILKNINMQISKGEIVAFLGKSGSGKSTLFRIISNIESLSSGTVSINGTVGLVFQDFQLFPHMTVLDNLIYTPVKVLKQEKSKVLALAKNYLQQFDLICKQKKYPKQLSGGEKQRIAIIRTLMIQPQVMVFDEPTSALDSNMIEKLKEIMRQIAKMGITILFSSHQLDFVECLATRRIYLENGCVSTK
jgi:ABC-type polar amino acid transport system ATPase subunit